MLGIFLCVYIIISMTTLRRLQQRRAPPKKSSFGFGSLGFGATGDKDNSMWVLWMVIGVVILFLILGGCYCYRDYFGNILGSGGGKHASRMKELEVLYFFSPNCPWCKKMTAVLEKEGVKGALTMVDVTTEEGKKMANEYGAAKKGIPAFISKKNKTGTVGFRENLDEMLTALEKKPDPAAMAQQQKEQADVPQMNPEEIRQKVSQLGIMLFASPTCGWCNKLKTEMEEAGVLNMIEVIDISQPEGQEMIKQYIKEFRGVPVTYSKNTQKHVVGYKPLSGVIAGLQ